MAHKAALSSLAGQSDDRHRHSVGPNLLCQSLGFEIHWIGEAVREEQGLRKLETLRANGWQAAHGSLFHPKGAALASSSPKKEKAVALGLSF